TSAPEVRRIEWPLLWKTEFSSAVSPAIGCGGTTAFLLRGRARPSLLGGPRERSPVDQPMGKKPARARVNTSTRFGWWWPRRWSGERTSTVRLEASSQRPTPHGTPPGLARRTSPDAGSVTIRERRRRSTVATGRPGWRYLGAPG